MWWDGANLNVGQKSNGSAPKILGSFGGGFGADRLRSGAFSGTWITGEAAGGGTDFPPSAMNIPVAESGWKVAFDASKSSSAYFRTDDKITPVCLKIGGYLIKY